MIGQGRDGGGYRCGAAVRGECWNRATVSRDLAHAGIFRAVIDRLLALDGAADVLVRMAKDLAAMQGDVHMQVEKLRAELRKAEADVKTCGQALLISPNSLYLGAMLDAAEKRKADLEEGLRKLEARASQEMVLPSREEILRAASDLTCDLSDGNAAADVLLHQLTTPITALPFQRIDCDLVVLRARFKLNLLPLLPAQWRQLVREADVDLEANRLLTEALVVDLFEPPSPVKFARQALALSRQLPRLTGEEIAKMLGTTRRSAYDAIKLGELMEVQGIEGPYVELTDCPVRASRWRQRRRKGGDVAESAA